MENDGISVTFLDLQISIVDNRLVTTVYSKPTDSHIYLNGSSCHPKASKKGISKGVALRLRRICSTDDDYALQSKKYMAYLVSCGHNPDLVKSTFQEVGNIPRTEARRKRRGINGSSKNIIFASEFNPRGPNVANVLQKHLAVLQSNPKVT